jgi:hypothetical protein
MPPGSESVWLETCRLPFNAADAPEIPSLKRKIESVCVRRSALAAIHRERHPSDRSGQASDGAPGALGVLRARCAARADPVGAVPPPAGDVGTEQAPENAAVVAQLQVQQLVDDHVVLKRAGFVDQ